MWARVTSSSRASNSRSRRRERSVTMAMHIAFVGVPVPHQPRAVLSVRRTCRRRCLPHAAPALPSSAPPARSDAYTPPSLFAQGHTQAEVAGDLGVSRQAVSRWHARFDQGLKDYLLNEIGLGSLSNDLPSSH